MFDGIYKTKRTISELPEHRRLKYKELNDTCEALINAYKNDNKEMVDNFFDAIKIIRSEMLSFNRGS